MQLRNRWRTSHQRFSRTLEAADSARVKATTGPVNRGTVGPVSEAGRPFTFTWTPWNATAEGDLAVGVEAAAGAVAEECPVVVVVAETPAVGAEAAAAAAAEEEETLRPRPPSVISRSLETITIIN